jgi:hypothetical protein
VEKTALVISAAALDAKTSYPQPGILACEILRNRRDIAQREVVSITTSRPWYVDSVEGSTQFDVFPDALVELSINE